MTSWWLYFFVIVPILLIATLTVLAAWWEAVDLGGPHREAYDEMLCCRDASYLCKKSPEDKTCEDVSEARRAYALKLESWFKIIKAYPNWRLCTLVSVGGAIILTGLGIIFYYFRCVIPVPIFGISLFVLSFVLMYITCVTCVRFYIFHALTPGSQFRDDPLCV